MTKNILSYDAKLFLDVLQDRFEPQIKKLLLNRQNRKGKIPACIMDVENEDPHWKVLPPPEDILDRRVEIHRTTS